jgi:hypothetical protein
MSYLKLKSTPQYYTIYVAKSVLQMIHFDKILKKISCKTTKV